MRLHSCEGKLVRLSERGVTPPDLPNVAKGGMYRVGKTDGMYTNCFDKDNNLFFIAAWTEVVT